MVGTVVAKEMTDTWQRNLRSLWFAQFVAMIGMSACLPFLPLYVKQLGVPASEANLWAGLIIAAPFFTASVLTPVWGSLGDKYGQKPMVLRAVIGLGLTVTCMAFATNIWTLFFLRVLQGAVSGFVASNNAFVSVQTPSDKVSGALATLQTSISAGNVIGPLIGGFVSDWIGFQSVFFLVGLLCVVSTLIIYKKVHEDRSLIAGNATTVKKSITGLIQSRDLRLLLLLVLLSQTSIVLASPIFTFYLEHLGAPRQMLGSLAGLVVSIVGICVVISSPWWGKYANKVGALKTITYTSAIVTIGQLLQAFVPSYLWLFPLRALVGLGSGAVVPLFYGEMAKRAPTGGRGGIMGLASSATLIGNLAGPLICSGISHFDHSFVAVFLSQSALMAIVWWIVRTKFKPSATIP